MKRIMAVTIMVVLASNLAYAQTKGGVRSVDFRNYIYEPSWVSDNKRLTLRNGQYMGDGNALTELVTVAYGDFNGDGQEDAAVAIGSEVKGSMGYVEEYYVYIYNNGVLKQVLYAQREKPQKKMRVVGRSLQITAPYWTAEDAHCCPSFIETTTYGWKNGKMVVSKRHRVRSRQ